MVKNTLSGKSKSDFNLLSKVIGEAKRKKTREPESDYGKTFRDYGLLGVAAKATYRAVTGQPIRKQKSKKGADFDNSDFFNRFRDIYNDELQLNVPKLLEDTLENPTGSFQRQSKKVNLELNNLNETATEINKTTKILDKKLDKIQKTLDNLKNDDDNGLFGGDGGDIDIDLDKRRRRNRGRRFRNRAGRFFRGARNLASRGGQLALRGLTFGGGVPAAVAAGGAAATYFANEAAKGEAGKAMADVVNKETEDMGFSMTGAMAPDWALGSTIQQTQEQTDAQKKAIQAEQEKLKDAPWYTRWYGIGKDKYLNQQKPTTDPAREIRKQRARDESDALRGEANVAQEFAIKMGMSPDNVRAKMEGGVPTEINGVPVPDELYTNDQRNKIKMAREMRASMELSERAMGGDKAAQAELSRRATEVPQADLPAIGASPISGTVNGFPIPGGQPAAPISETAAEKSKDPVLVVPTALAAGTYYLTTDKPARTMDVTAGASRAMGIGRQTSATMGGARLGAGAAGAAAAGVAPKISVPSGNGAPSPASMKEAVGLPPTAPSTAMPTTGEQLAQRSALALTGPSMPGATSAPQSMGTATGGVVTGDKISGGTGPMTSPTPSPTRAGGQTATPVPQSQIDPDKVIAGVTTGKIRPTDAVVQEALKMKGLHEVGDRQEIRKYLASGGKQGNIDPATTAWCAAFVNASLARAGIQGTGGNLASDFHNWGEGVDDPTQIKAGDVLVRNTSFSGTGSHVEIATGPAYKDENGNWKVPTVGGNTGKGSSSVATDTLTLGTKGNTYSARRAAPSNYSPEALAALKSEGKRQGAAEEQASNAVKQASGPTTGSTPTASATPTGSPMTVTPGQERTDDSKTAYYDKMYNSLYKAAVEKGVENPDVVAKLGATQSSLETGYGKHMVGNNAFGIKANQGGKSVSASTQEFEGGRMVTKNQNFRAYEKPEDSASDYIDFLQKNPRYKGVLAAKNIDEAIAAQSKTGYATDPNYGAKLASINQKMGEGAPKATTQVATADTPAPTATEAKGEMSDEQIRKIMESSEQVKPGEDNMSASEVRKGFEETSAPPDAPRAAAAPAAASIPTPNPGRAIPSQARAPDPMQQMMGMVQTFMSGQGGVPNISQPTPLPKGIGDFAFRKGEMPWGMAKTMSRDSQGVTTMFDAAGGAAGIFAGGGQEAFQ